MSIITVGGDMRYAHLTALAAAQSLKIAAIGLEKCPVAVPGASIDAVSEARALILPNPWRNGLSLPYAAHPFTLDDVLSRAAPGTLLLLSDTARMQPVQIEGLVPVDLSADRQYALKNARLTAEAAVARALQLSDRALVDSMCLVIGYGKIGCQLCRLLRALGAETAVAVRRESVHAEIREDGVSAFRMNDLPALLPRAHFVFSTPPATVLDTALLRLVRPDALLMDLASPPYGFDLQQALALSRNAVRENGLPGRCCPRSAGIALLEAVRRALSAQAKGESV